MGVIFAILTAILVILKLLGVITIGWFWVLLPAFVPLVMVFLFLLSMVGLMFWLDKK